MDEELSDKQPENPSQSDNTDQPPRRTSQRVHKPPIRYGVDEYADVASQPIAHGTFKTNEPTTLSEAMTSSNAKEWTAAAEAEYQSLIENNTWSLVKLPPGRSTVGCKWVLRLSTTAMGLLIGIKDV